MMAVNDAEQIIENELALQRPEVRRDQAAVLALLAPDFVEVDATGRTWDAEGVAAALAEQTGYLVPDTSDLTATPLAPDVQLLTYRDSGTVHSSIWVRGGSGSTWLLRFHQQTRLSP